MELLFKCRTELLHSRDSLIEPAYLSVLQPLSGFFSQRLAMILVFASNLEKHRCATIVHALIFDRKAFTFLFENRLLAFK